MSIRRYVATKDTTITNAFNDNLMTRAISSNMGASDILDVFSIYGQATTSSLEMARILIDFPINEIVSDRNNNLIGNSGSVQFILKLSNAPHAESTPSNFTLVATAVSSSWTEGFGLDMERYSDIGAANWISSSNNKSWHSQGGDYIGSGYTQYFDSGLEDLQIDITELVEKWITGNIPNYGIGIQLTSSLENSTTSYYTKKFFARSSEFFFKRPWIECRTEDFFQDNRKNFVISSSLLDSNDNLNTLVLNNRVKGQLKNIPSIGTGSELFVSIYAGITSPVPPALVLHNGFQKIQAGLYKTGIYTASLAVETTSSCLFDVWFSGTGSSANSIGSIIFATGSAIYPEVFEPSFDQQAIEYVIKTEQLKNAYKTNEKPRIKIIAREKNWSPNLYSVSYDEIETLLIDNLYYKVVRIQDGYEVIPYGTGSIKYTKTSYDGQANFFDLDMNLFEPGYSYGIKLGHYFENNFNEFKEIFKFRVE